ncbi:hypothetical protein N8978_01490 [Flavobacteriaceae bacterium]|nr:hypothetical protein [Flavobacteriaceae bacterium]
MKLKVVKYKNYGCMMESEESEGPFSNNFFWCFFELNNKEIINLQLVENLKNNKIIDIDYGFYYAKEELKTGQVHEYKFGKAKPNTREFSNEFFERFDILSSIKHLKENTKRHLFNRGGPTKEETKCIKNFYDKNLFKKRKEATNITFI